MAEKDDRHKKINYICRKDRVALLEKCKSKRDRLIIRMGYEVGLRASENTGIVLGEHKAKNNKHSGLFALFDELHENKKKMSFEFTLNGKYTKGGKTRTIYFSRELLMDMYDYYMTERSVIEKESGIKCMTLFVRSDREGKGFPISSSHASSLFRKLKDKCKHINKAQSYHDLRHSFATELYHSELLNPSGHETRSESAALIVVGERLGHVPGSNATKMYIRLRRVMESLEGIEVG
jgi:integrase